MESVDNKTLIQANECAEAFAKEKTPIFLEQFLNDTGIAQEMFDQISANLGAMSPDDFKKSLMNEYNFVFGRALAIAYAHGYVDRAQGKHVKTMITGLKKNVKF